MFLIAFVVTVVVGVLKLLGVGLVASVTWPLWWTVLGCIVAVWIAFYMTFIAGAFIALIKGGK